MPKYVDADEIEKCFDPDTWQGEMMIAIANGLPSADVSPVRRGEWGQCSAFDEDENVYTCSVCGEPWQLIDGTPAENNMHFCPNCGADLR